MTDWNLAREVLDIVAIMTGSYVLGYLHGRKTQ